MPARPEPRPPAHAAPHVDVLRPELTVKFLRTFGGASLCPSLRPRTNGRLVALLGHDRAVALAEHVGLASHRVPPAKRRASAWLAWSGWPVAEIARLLHTSDVTVRLYLREHEAGRGPR
jgi:enoyl-CoA hydratase/carnithine racemase